MTEVLTIDFDIIMKPSIEIYNDLIGDSKDIQSIIKQNPGIEYCLPPDLSIYGAITRLIMRFIKQLNEDDVYFIREHQHICDIIKGLDKCNLINIDHHHDIGYSGVSINSAVRMPECGNWVKYLTDLGKINEYTWINNSNSMFPNKYMGNRYITNGSTIDRFMPDEKYKPDKLIICLSLQWIPSSMLPLFYTWMGICEEYYNKEFNFLEVKA